MPFSVAVCTSPTTSTKVSAPGRRQVKVVVEVARHEHALEQAAQVDLDVVALDLDQLGTRTGLVVGEAGGSVAHDGTVAPRRGWTRRRLAGGVGRRRHRGAGRHRVGGDAAGRLGACARRARGRRSRCVVSWSSTPAPRSILAIDSHERVFCLRQYRHPARRRFVELPAGLLDVEGEDALEAARREPRRGGPPLGHRLGRPGQHLGLARAVAGGAPPLPGPGAAARSSPTSWPSTRRPT